MNANRYAKQEECLPLERRGVERVQNNNVSGENVNKLK